MSIHDPALVRSTMYGMSAGDAYLMKRLDELETELGKKKEAAKKEAKPKTFTFIEVALFCMGTGPVVGMLMLMGYVHLWHMTAEVMKTLH